PTRSPTCSPNSAAMKRAAERAASRRGSSMTSLRPWAQGASSRAGGTRVVLPAPGAAWITKEEWDSNCRRISGSKESMGSGFKGLAECPGQGDLGAVAVGGVLEGRQQAEGGEIYAAAHPLAEGTAAEAGVALGEDGRIEFEHLRHLAAHAVVHPPIVVTARPEVGAELVLQIGQVYVERGIGAVGLVGADAHALQRVAARQGVEIQLVPLAEEIYPGEIIREREAVALGAVAEEVRMLVQVVHGEGVIAEDIVAGRGDGVIRQCRQREP